MADRRKSPSDRRIYFATRGESPDAFLSARQLARAFAARSGESTADLLYPLFFPPVGISVNPSSGLTVGGTTVTVTGTGFLQNATVRFGGTLATVQSITPTAIIVKTPVHAAGLVNVVVTNPDGQTSTLVNGFTFTGLLIPDDANTIAHLYVYGGLVKDTITGINWTESGTVPRVASASMGFPNAKNAEGIGPFTTANFFTGPSGAGGTNFAGDFIVTIIYKQTADSLHNDILVGADSCTSAGSNTKGYALQALYNNSTSETVNTNFYNGGFGVGSDGGIITKNTITIYSVGRAGTTVFSKFNTTATVSTTNAGFAGNPATVGTVIGYGYSPNPAGGTADPFPGVIYEVRFQSATPSGAVLDALHTAIRN